MFQIQSIVDNVRKHLLRQILHGELHPGQQVKEQEIASSLGISRPPVREAMKFLEADGLIVRKPNRGAFVATVTEHDAWEIYTLKCSLYETATTLAFDNISEKDIEKWEAVVAEMQGCIFAVPPDVVRYQSLNQEFHDIMFRISGHNRLKRICRMLHHQMNRFSCISLMDEPHLKQSFAYHQAILGAIKARDMDRTIRVTREHILKGLEIVQDIIAGETRSNDQAADNGSGKNAGGRRSGFGGDVDTRAA